MKITVHEKKVESADTLDSFDDALERALVGLQRAGGLDDLVEDDPEYEDELQYRKSNVRDKLETLYEEMFDQLQRNGYVTIYRAIKAKDVDAIDKEYLGVCWTIYEDTADEFAATNNGGNFIIRAEAPIEAIDQERTWDAIGANDDEWEVNIEDTDLLKNIAITKRKHKDWEHPLWSKE